MPVWGQNSYVSTLARKGCGVPTVLAITKPKMIAQRTYSMFGSARWCALPYDAIDCSTTLPAKPVANSSTRPGTNRTRPRTGDLRAAADGVAIRVAISSPGHATDDAEFDQ